MIPIIILVQGEGVVSQSTLTTVFYSPTYIKQDLSCTPQYGEGCIHRGSTVRTFIDSPYKQKCLLRVYMGAFAMNLKGSQGASIRGSTRDLQKSYADLRFEGFRAVDFQGLMGFGLQGLKAFGALGFGVSGLLEFEGFTVEARKLEHHNHHNLKVQYTESPHQSS